MSGGGRPDQPGRHEARLALVEVIADAHGPSLDAEPKIADEDELRIIRSRRRHLLVARSGVLPVGVGPAVVESGLTVEGDIDRAVEARGVAKQDVLCVEISRRAPVQGGSVRRAVPRADRELSLIHI